MSATCNGVIDTGFVGLGYAKVAFLGLVQGITELLPISSTAHMRIVPALLGWQDPGTAFSAAMQLAALVGVVSYFWKDIAGLATGSTTAVLKGDFKNRDLTMVLYILIGTLPIIVGGLALQKILNACNSPMRGVAVIGAACLVMAVLLAVTELTAKHRRTMEQASFLDIILVGIAQAFALVPGVSRSGSTLTAALALGFKREEAARFSFLLGLPAIALAGLKEVAELHKAHLDGHGWSILAVGLIVGAISSVVAIWGLMRFLERFSTWPFVIYRAVLGVLLLAGAAYGFIH
jgi:undecaprenyl-diphosphatase